MHIQCPNDLFEVHAAAARRTKIPTAARIAKIEMAGQDARATVERHDRVFDVDVIDPVREGPQELDRINPLPQQMAGVEVETEFLATIDRRERLLGAVEIERDLGRMDFEREADAAIGEDVQDRVETLGEECVALVDHRLRTSAETNRACARCSNR